MEKVLIEVRLAKELRKINTMKVLEGSKNLLSIS